MNSPELQYVIDAVREYFDVFKNTDEHIERLNALSTDYCCGTSFHVNRVEQASKAGDLSSPPQKIVSVIFREDSDDRIHSRVLLSYPLLTGLSSDGFWRTCSAGYLHLNEDIIFCRRVSG